MLVMHTFQSFSFFLKYSFLCSRHYCLSERLSGQKTTEKRRQTKGQTQKQRQAGRKNKEKKQVRVLDAKNIFSSFFLPRGP